MSELLPESEYWHLSITARNANEFVDRKDILLTHINNMPGIRYRELSRLTGLSNGTLTYHLNRLEKSSQVRVDRQKEKRTTRYYSIDVPPQETDILRQLRNEVSRQIIKLILEHDLCTFNEIVFHYFLASEKVEGCRDIICHVRRGISNVSNCWPQFGIRHSLQI